MRYLLIALVAFTVLATPVLSRAASYSDDFDDGVMNPALWTYVEDTGNGWMTEAGGKLNYFSNGRYDHSWADYDSVWTFDLNSDFMFTTDFNFSYTGAAGGGVGLGIYNDDSDYSAGIGAEKEMDSDGGAPIFWSGVEKWIGPGMGDDVTIWQDKDPRMITSGWLGIRYLSSSDIMEFVAFDQYGIQAGGSLRNNFKNDVGGGVGFWRVALDGFGEGWAVIRDGEANLDNFQAAVTPEPISCALFLFGGGAMVLARKKKINGR